MTSPSKTPEQGVGIYEHDATQGPACAISAGAGTIYRNYFATVNGKIGQTEDNQIDCLANLGEALGNSNSRLWVMQNGYALPSFAGLQEIAARLLQSSDAERDELRGLVRIGIQWDTQVTLTDCSHLVSQAYCSALPIAYSEQPVHRWESFACLVLEACYEATICAGIVNSRTAGNNKVFLTLVGGSAFGNPEKWILAAIQRAVNLYRTVDLDVAIVSYRRLNPGVRRLVDVAAPKSRSSN
jgi:hypothetical protein